jgi:Leucine-rich repeat (LRR) protein
MVFNVKYPNDNKIYKVDSFDEIKSNCIYLNCSYNDLNSLEGIENLTQLQELDCCENNLTSLEPIKYLTQLQYLICNDNNITSLEGIKHLTQLQELECSDNELTSLEFIKHLTLLQELNCWGNNLTSLEGIENLSQLQKLWCSSNNLTSLESIKHLTQLQQLRCYRNNITSLEGIENFTQLQELDCCQNYITSLEPIKHLKQLQELYCSYNQLSSLEPIKHLIQLQTLYCNNNQLTSLESIKHLTQLQELECGNNQLTSLPLEIINLRNLTYINYDNNPIDNIPIQLLRFIDRIQQGNIKQVNVYTNSQNVHDSSIQLSVFNSINRLTEHIKEPFNLEQLTTEIVEDTTINCKERIIQYMSNTEIHSLLLLNFSEILWLVWNEIKEFNEDTQVEIKKRLNEEITEAECMCYTGRCNRLINCLNGFSDLVEIKIQDSSQIGNVIVVVKERLEGEEKYTIEEHKKIVKKELLERGYELDIINEWIKYIE